MKSTAANKLTAGTVASVLLKRAAAHSAGMEKGVASNASAPSLATQYEFSSSEGKAISMAILQIDPGDLGGKWDHDTTAADKKSTPVTTPEAVAAAPSMGGRFKKKQQDEEPQKPTVEAPKKSNFAPKGKRDGKLNPFQIYGQSIKYIQSRTVTLANSSTNFSHLAADIAKESDEAAGIIPDTVPDTDESNNLGARVPVELLQRQLALGKKSDQTAFFKFIAMAEHLTLDIFLLGRDKLMFVAKYMQNLPITIQELLEELHGVVDPSYDPSNREVYNQWRATDTRLAKMHPKEKSKGVFSDYNSLSNSELTGKRTEAHVRTLLKLDLTKEEDWKVWADACKEISIRSQVSPFTLKPQGEVSGRELWRYRRVAVACNDTARRVHAVKFHIDALQRKEATSQLRKPTTRQSSSADSSDFTFQFEDTAQYDIPVANIISDILHLRAEALRMFVVRLMELTVWYAKEKRPFDAEIILFLEKGAPKIFAVIGDHPNDEWESIIDIFYTHHLPHLMMKAGFAPVVFQQHVFPALQSLLDRGVFHRSERQTGSVEATEEDEVEGAGRGGARLTTQAGDRNEMQVSKNAGVALWKAQVQDQLVESMKTTWNFSKVSLSGRCREELGSRPLMLQAFLKAVEVDRVGLSTLWWNSDWLDVDPLRAQIVHWLAAFNRTKFNPDKIHITKMNKDEVLACSGVNWGPVLQVIAYDSSAADVFIEQIKTYKDSFTTAIEQLGTIEEPTPVPTTPKKKKKGGKKKSKAQEADTVAQPQEEPSASIPTHFVPPQRTTPLSALERTEIGLALFRMVCYRDAGNANGSLMPSDIITALFDDLGQLIKQDDGLYCLYLSAMRLCGPLTYSDAVEWERMYDVALTRFPASRRQDDSASLKSLPFFDLSGRGHLLPTNRFSTSMGLITILGLESMSITPSSITPSTRAPVESYFSTRAPLINFGDLLNVIVEKRTLEETKAMEPKETGRGGPTSKKQLDRDDAGAVFLSVSEKYLEDYTQAQHVAESASARSDANEKRGAPATVAAESASASEDSNSTTNNNEIKPASARIGTAPAPGIILIRELSGLLRTECSELFFGIVNLALQQLAHDKVQQKMLIARLRYMLIYHDGITIPKTFVVDFSDWAHFSTSRWPHTYFGNDTPSLKLYYHQITLRRLLLAHDLAAIDRKGPHIDQFLPQTQLPSPYSSWVMLGVMSAIRKDAALRASRSEIREKVDVIIAEFMENHGLMARLHARFNSEPRVITPPRFAATVSPSARRVGELVHRFANPEGGERDMALKSLALVNFTTLADFIDNKSGDALLRQWWSRVHVSMTTRQSIFVPLEQIDCPFLKGQWLHRVGRNYFPRLLRNKEHMYSCVSPAMRRLMWCVISDSCRLLESPLSPLACPAVPLKSQKTGDGESGGGGRTRLPPPPSLVGMSSRADGTPDHTSTTVDALLASDLAAAGSTSPTSSSPAKYQRLELDSNNKGMELLAGNGTFSKDGVEAEIPLVPQALEFARRMQLSLRDRLKFDGDAARGIQLVRHSLVEGVARMVAYMGCPPWWDKQLRFRLYFVRRLIGQPAFLRSFTHQQLLIPMDAPILDPAHLNVAGGPTDPFADTESKQSCSGYRYRELLPNPTSVWIPGEVQGFGQEEPDLEQAGGATSGDSNNTDEAAFTLNDRSSSMPAANGGTNSIDEDSSADATTTTPQQQDASSKKEEENKYMPVIAAPYCFSTREANEVLVQFAGCLQMIGDTTGLPTGGENQGGGASPPSSAASDTLKPITLNKNRLVKIGPDGRPHESYTSPIVLLDTINYAQDLWPKVRPTRYMPTEEIIEFLTFIGAAMLASNAVPKNVRRHYGNCVRQLLGELLTSKNHPNAALYFTQVYSLYRSKLYSIIDAAVAYDLHLVGDIPLLYFAERLGLVATEGGHGRMARHDAISNKAARGIAVVGPRAKQYELKKSQKVSTLTRIDDVPSLLDDENEVDGSQQQDASTSSNNNNNYSFGGGGDGSGKKKKKKKNKNKNKGGGGGGFSGYQGGGAPNQGSTFDE